MHVHIRIQEGKRRTWMHLPKDTYVCTRISHTHAHTCTRIQINGWPTWKNVCNDNSIMKCEPGMSCIGGHVYVHLRVQNAPVHSCICLYGRGRAHGHAISLAGWGMQKTVGIPICTCSFPAGWCVMNEEGIALLILNDNSCELPDLSSEMWHEWISGSEWQALPKE